MMRPGLQIRLDEDAFATGSIVYNFGSRTQTRSTILQHMLVPKVVHRTFLSARRNVAHHPDAQRTVKRISAKVICLGTGKGMPSQFRNGKFPRYVKYPRC
jgi:ribonuclease Z